ncbi:MAG: hypothetical protein JXX14_25710 [Deltaproteobacteria bacterium]|nr:hypothetical protein [Deltaproteobacteria bacterium]
MKLLYPSIFITLFPFVSGCVLLQGSDSCPIGFERAKAGNCVQNLSCLEKEECINAGKCTYAPGDRCVATRPIDCKQSTNCTKLGECVFKPNNVGNRSVGICVADGEGCRASEVCAEFGKCTPGDDGFCVVGGDTDCTKSKVCREMGRCTASKLKRADGKPARILSCQQ